MGTVFSFLLCYFLWEGVGVLGTSQGRSVADPSSGGSFAKNLGVFSQLILGLAQWVWKTTPGKMVSVTSQKTEPFRKISRS